MSKDIYEDGKRKLGKREDINGETKSTYVYLRARMHYNYCLRFLVFKLYVLRNCSHSNYCVFCVPKPTVNMVTASIVMLTFEL